MIVKFKVFGVPKMQFHSLSDTLNHHLLPCDPIQISYEVKMNEEFTIGDFVYDVEVEMEDTNRAKLPSLGMSVALQKELDSLDSKISDLMGLASKCLSKMEFYQKFAENPCEVINKWIAGMSKDLESIMGERGLEYSEVDLSDVFKSTKCADSVYHYLNTKRLK